MANNLGSPHTEILTGPARKAKRSCRIKAKLCNPQRDDRTLRMNAAGPIPGNYLGHEPAAATFDLDQIPDHRNWPFEPIFILAKLALGDDFAILQSDTFDPVAHLS